jgi:hypothetical protein
MDRDPGNGLFPGRPGRSGLLPDVQTVFSPNPVDDQERSNASRSTAVGRSISDAMITTQMRSGVATQLGTRATLDLIL